MRVSVYIAWIDLNTTSAGINSDLAPCISHASSSDQWLTSGEHDAITDA
jgi:hypothetical protein